jgi:nucleotide-binding universal stress UspA family protein
MSTSIEAAIQQVPAVSRTDRPSRALTRQVLVAVGLGQDTSAAVSVAAAVATAAGAELMLLGVAPVAMPPADEVAIGLQGPCISGHWPDQQALDQMTRDYVDEIAVRLPAGLRVRTALDWGSYAGGLLHACRVEHPDLVVICDVHGGRLRRLLHDRSTRRILRHADVPVLVVPVEM